MHEGGDRLGGYTTLWGTTDAPPVDGYRATLDRTWPTLELELRERANTGRDQS